MKIIYFIYNQSLLLLAFHDYQIDEIHNMFYFLRISGSICIYIYINNLFHI